MSQLEIPDFVHQRILQLRQRTGASIEILRELYLEIFIKSEQSARKTFPKASEEDLIILRQRFAIGKLWTDMVRFHYPMTDKKLQKYRKKILKIHLPKWDAREEFR